MRDKRPLVIGIAAAILIGALCGAFVLGVFRSDAERATDAVTELMESYVVPVADEDGKEPEDAAWPAADYGDAATMEVLQKYGVSADEWHRHCFGHFSYQVGEASVGDGSGIVSVTVTNTSLAAALEAAGADFSSFSSTQEAEDAYAQGGKAGLFTNLVQRVYDHLDANESPVTTTIDVPCAKGEDGSWEPQVSGNESFFSALYGGSNVIAGLAPAPAEGDAAAEAEPAA